VRDFRLWWGLFVLFAVVSVVVVQRGYRKWRSARDLLARVDVPGRAEYARRLRREGWRLVCMAASLVAMTLLVFAVFLGAPTGVILGLRAAAVLAVIAVVGLSLLR
jgi:nitroreductase